MRNRHVTELVTHLMWAKGQRTLSWLISQPDRLKLAYPGESGYLPMNAVGFKTSGNVATTTYGRSGIAIIRDSAQFPRLTP